MALYNVDRLVLQGNKTITGFGNRVSSHFIFGHVTSVCVASLPHPSIYDILSDIRDKREGTSGYVKLGSYRLHSTDSFIVAHMGSNISSAGKMVVSSPF